MCLGLLRDKHRILEAPRTPKIVFIGGSNLLFGLDGGMVERELHRPVAIMGLCLMLPIQYLFEEVKDSVNPGDLIVLAPEYANLSSEYSAPAAVNNVLDIYPQAFWWIVRSGCVSLDQMPTFIGHLRALGLQKLDYASRHLAQIAQHRCRWTHGKMYPGLEVINPENMDRYGGLTWHLRQKNDGNPSTYTFRTANHIGDAEAKSINSFDAFCKSRGAKFVIIPVPTYEGHYKKERPKVENLLKESAEKLTAKWVAEPARYVFPKRMIFNEQYHLNKTGRPVRTQMVIDDLRPVLKQIDDNMTHLRQ